MNFTEQLARDGGIVLHIRSERCGCVANKLCHCGDQCINCGITLAQAQGTFHTKHTE